MLQRSATSATLLVLAQCMHVSRIISHARTVHRVRKNQCKNGGSRSLHLAAITQPQYVDVCQQSLVSHGEPWWTGLDPERENQPWLRRTNPRPSRLAASPGVVGAVVHGRSNVLTNDVREAHEVDPTKTSTANSAGNPSIDPTCSLVSNPADNTTCNVNYLFFCFVGQSLAYVVAEHPIAVLVVHLLFPNVAF